MARRISPAEGGQPLTCSRAQSQQAPTPSPSKGMPFDGLGVGACCDCAREQVKGCPPSAGDILRAMDA